MIRILIVDDQRLVREMLKTLLSTEPDLEIVGTAEDGEDAVEKVKQLRPDLVLLDMVMPKMDGVTATQFIHEYSPAAKIIILSVCDDQEYLYNSVQAGASGYLLKTTSPEELKQTIRNVHQGYSQFGPGLLEKITQKTLNSDSEAIPPTIINSSATSVVEPTASATLPELDSTSKSPQLQHSPINWRQVAVLSSIGITVLAGVYWWKSLSIKPSPSLALNQISAPTEIELRGTIKPEQTLEIRANNTSVVEEVYVEPGERVVKNQPLVLLENVEIQKAKAEKQQQQQLNEQQIQKALASQQAAQAQIEEQKAQIERLKQEREPLQAQIESAKTQTALAQNKADIATQTTKSPETAQALYQQATAEFERYNQLYQQGAIAEERLEQAQANLNAAQSEYLQAQAAATAAQELETAIANQTQLETAIAALQTEEQLATAESQLKTAQSQYDQVTDQLALLEQEAKKISQELEMETTVTLRADADGFVLSLPVEVGEQVSDDSVLVDLAQLETLKIEVPVAASVAEQLSLGQPASVIVSLDENVEGLTGEIAAIKPAVVPNSTGTVEVEFSNPERHFLVDQEATVKF